MVPLEGVAAEGDARHEQEPSATDPRTPVDCSLSPQRAATQLGEILPTRTRRGIITIKMLPQSLFDREGTDVRRSEGVWMGAVCTGGVDGWEGSSSDDGSGTSGAWPRHRAAARIQTLLCTDASSRNSADSGIAELSLLKRPL